MPKTSVSDWDETAANNSDLNGTNIADNSMATGAVDDVIREMMAQIATALGSGNELQPYDAGLVPIAALTTAADKMIYTTASDTYAVTALTAAGRAILDDADASAQRTTLGLGTASVAALLDEDDMSSDDATAAASQQSVKAYVDASVAPDNFGTQLYHLQDQKSSGTAGGTATSGSWEKRTLNTEATSEISGASVSSSVITLPAGTYYAEGFAPAYRCDSHQTRLRKTDATAATVLVGSSSETRSGADTVVTHSFISGRFTLAGSSTLELQHQVQTTRATDGHGIAATFGEVEVYSDLKIWKIA